MNTTTRTDIAEIRDLMLVPVRAMRERDADALVARFTDDVVEYSLAPPLRQPNASTRDPDAVRDWFAGFEGQIGFEVRDLEITVANDLAYCHGLNRLSATPVGSPAAFSLWFRFTAGLRKVDGAWRIAHLHESTPFHMEMTADGIFPSAVGLTP